MSGLAWFEPSEQAVDNKNKLLRKSSYFLAFSRKLTLGPLLAQRLSREEVKLPTGMMGNYPAFFHSAPCMLSGICCSSFGDEFQFVSKVQLGVEEI